MNEVKKVKSNIRSYAGYKDAERTKNAYLSDEALYELIAAAEAEPMMRPPKGFREEVIERVRRKRKRTRNMSLFSYSMKVIAATAAAVCLVLIVPENVRTDKSCVSGERLEWQAGELPEERDSEENWPARGDFLNRFSSRLDGFCSAFNGRLNQLVGTEGHDL